MDSLDILKKLLVDAFEEPNSDVQYMLKDGTALYCYYNGGVPFLDFLPLDLKDSRSISMSEAMDILDGDE